MVCKIKGSGEVVDVTFPVDKEIKKTYPDLKKTTALILLSIKGNQYCEGDYLKKIIEKSLLTYGVTTILIADQVYHHNLKKKDFKPEQEPDLQKEAECLGEKYFLKNLNSFIEPLGVTKDEIEKFKKEYANKTFLEKINMLNDLAKQKNKEYKVLNWSGWVSKFNWQRKIEHNSAVFTYQNALETFLRKEFSYKQAIESSAEQYVKRHQNQLKLEPASSESFKLQTSQDYLKFKLQTSQDYLKDESPKVVLTALALKINFIIYPGDIPESFDIVRDLFKKDNQHIYWTDVVFKKKTSREKNKSRQEEGNKSRQESSDPHPLPFITLGQRFWIILRSQSSNEEKVASLNQLQLVASLSQSSEKSFICRRNSR